MFSQGRLANTISTDGGEVPYGSGSGRLGLKAEPERGVLSRNCRTLNMNRSWEVKRAQGDISLFLAHSMSAKLSSIPGRLPNGAKTTNPIYRLY